MNVPSPERYAVHKLIVASRRVGPGRTKVAKDVAQATSLFEALAATRQGDLLRDAWEEAWRRGPTWRKALTVGRERLAPQSEELLTTLLAYKD